MKPARHLSLLVTNERAFLTVGILECIIFSAVLMFFAPLSLSLSLSLSL